MHKRGVSHAPPLAAPTITRHNLLPPPAAPVVAYVSWSPFRDRRMPDRGLSSRHPGRFNIEWYRHESCLLSVVVTGQPVGPGRGFYQSPAQPSGAGWRCGDPSWHICHCPHGPLSRQTCAGGARRQPVDRHRRHLSQKPAWGPAADHR